VSCKRSFLHVTGFCENEETFPLLGWIVVAAKNAGNHGKHYPHELGGYGYIVKTFLQKQDRNLQRTRRQ
jgi:hypothetical protein